MEVWSAFHIAQRKNESQLQKLEGTKYTWSQVAPVLEGTRPTGPKGRLRLCATAVCLSPVMMCRQLPRLLRRMRGQRLLHGFRESRDHVGLSFIS